MKCCICEFEGTGKAFSNHLQKAHKTSSKEYTRQYIQQDYKGCVNCGEETRYVAFSFKKYCKNCAKIGMKEGGKIGGKSEAWNKGKTKETDERIKGRAGKDNSFWGKKHTKETKNRISMTKQLGSVEVLQRLLDRNEEFEILTPVEKYFSRQRQYLDFKCKKCNFVCKKTLQAFERGSLCPKCYPVNKSAAEIEIFEYIKGLGFESVINGDRSLIKPKEIDITLKQNNFGVEYNGLYWHSDIVDSTKKEDMLWKTQECKKLGVKLMHIFSDEWEYKKEICKSMINNRLGLCESKIWARKCVVRLISKKDFSDFMNLSHISGPVNSSIRLGLFYNDELVSAIGFRKPRQKKWQGYFEISRFATNCNTVVVGGLGKFIKYYKTNYSNPLMTYADRRFGEGLGYEKVGFEYYGETGVDYWYSDGRQRYDRFVVKAENGKSEREKAAEMNLYKVWGCGSNIWFLRQQHFDVSSDK